MRHFSLSICVLLIFTCVQVGLAQTKQGVILYNSVPYLAEYTEDGKVLKLIEKKPNYLKGYQLVPTSNSASTPLLASDNQSVAPTSNVGKPPSVSISRKFIDFDGGKALLSDVSVKRLDAIIEYLATNPNDKVMIIAHRSDETDRIYQLASNRIDSCKKYLEIKGVSNHQIITNSVYAPSLANKVAITYVQ